MLFFWVQGNMSQRITAFLTPEMVNHNAIFYKLVFRENKKRETIEASTSRAPLEEPTSQEGNLADEDEFWANLNIEKEE